jgi:hypothetical protein
MRATLLIAAAIALSSTVSAHMCAVYPPQRGGVPTNLTEVRKPRPSTTAAWLMAILSRTLLAVRFIAEPSRKLLLSLQVHVYVA